MIERTLPRVRITDYLQTRIGRREGKRETGGRGRGNINAIYNYKSYIPLDSCAIVVGIILYIIRVLTRREI